MIGLEGLSCVQFNLTNRALSGDGINTLTQNYFAWLTGIEEKACDVPALISRLTLCSLLRI